MSNPFEVDDEVNPFAEPTQVENTPFRNDYSSVQQQPPPQQSKPISYGEISSKVSNIALDEREISRREEILRERENRIKTQEDILQKAMQDGTLDNLRNHPRNFPFPFRVYSYYPEDELPPESIKMVNYFKWVFYLSSFMLIFNVVTNIINIGVGGGGSPVTLLLLSILYAFLLIVMHYEFIFMVLYNALKIGSGFKFFGFMFMSVIYTAILVILGIGIGGVFGGSIGIIDTIDLIADSDKKLIGIFGFIFFVLDCLVILAMVFLWLMALKYFRSAGLDRKAQQEATKIAADVAYEHRSTIISAAQENPDVAMSVARTAASYQFD